MIEILAAVGTALSAFLLPVLAAKRPLRAADRWLAVWLFAQCVFCAAVLVALVAPPRLAIAALLGGQAAVCAVGPAHYLHAVSALGESRHAAWYVPAAVAGGLLVLTLVVAMPLRVEAGALAADVRTPWLLILPVAALASASLYPAGVLRLLARRRERLKDQVSSFGDAFPGWLRLWAVSLLVVNAGLILVLVNAVVAAWPPKLHVAVILSIQVAHIAYVGHHGLTRPGVFGIPVRSRSSAARATPDHKSAREDYARLQALLSDEKPHTNPGLTAEMLAARLGWGPERLTDTLRHGGGVNFFDAINGARVQELQELIRRPENAGVSLLVLAYQAGFGSKSALYEAFRRHTGGTPAQWKRRAQA